MNRLAVSFATLAVLLAAGTAPGRADTVIAGETGDGAFYRIVVPDLWNGGLAIWNHGFELAPPAPLEPEDLGPLAALQLSEGFAVAASSYRQAGWAVFETNNDLRDLLDIFRFEVGMPDRIFLTGGSLGGLATAAAVEEAPLGKVAGALSLCGAVAGSRNWDGALDLRLTYDAVCEGVPGAFIPGGAEGLPEGAPVAPVDVVWAVNLCTGILQPPVLRTPGQSERLQRILDTARFPERFFLRNMLHVTFSMSDLVHDEEKLAGHIGTGNVGVVYGDPFIDLNIERVSPSTVGRNRLLENYTPTGSVGETKIVSLHTDKDGVVVVENESEYAAVVPPGNLTTAIVVEDVPSHCGFSEAEVAAAWEWLRAWAAGGPQPTALSLQLTCRVLEVLDFDGPCRIDPAFEIPPLDTRIRPRE